MISKAATAELRMVLLFLSLDAWRERSGIM